MKNKTATPEEVYASICEGIKKITDLLETDIANDRRDKIVNQIIELNKQLELLTKRFRRL
jgi:hypothetical protein